MNNSQLWPSAFNFNIGLRLLLESLKDFCNSLLYKLAELEKNCII